MLPNGQANHWRSTAYQQPVASRKREPISDDDELKAEIAKYLCVLSSGLIEEALRVMLSNYAAGKSSPQVASFVSTRLSEFQNPKFEKILGLLAAFDVAWREKFESDETSEVKAAIDSVVNNRHQIAHGRQVGISIGTFTGYHALVEKFIDDVDQLLT